MRSFVPLLGVLLGALGLSMVIIGITTLVRRAVPVRFQDHLRRKKQLTFSWRPFGWSRIALGSSAMFVAAAAFTDSRLVWKVMIVISFATGAAGQTLDKRARSPYVPEVVDEAAQNRWRLPPA
jgi:hypothetical protein